MRKPFHIALCCLLLNGVPIHAFNWQWYDRCAKLLFAPTLVLGVAGWMQWQRFYNKYQTISKRYQEATAENSKPKATEETSGTLKEEQIRKEQHCKICKKLNAVQEQNGTINIDPDADTMVVVADCITWYPRGPEVTILLEHCRKNLTLTVYSKEFTLKDAEDRFRGYKPFCLVKEQKIALSSNLISLIGTHPKMGIWDEDLNEIINNKLRVK